LQYFNALYSAVSLAKADYATMQIAIQQVFDPANNIDNLFIRELLTAIATAVLVLGALAAGPEVGVAAGSLANVIAGGINAGLLLITDNDMTWANLVSDAT
jgi:hypothetical protein